MKLRSLKVQLALFLGLFATYFLLIEKDFLLLLTILIALFFSITTDSLINFLKSKKIGITESSVVTGLIIGYVLSGDQSWWVIALAGIFAISSKHLIRFRKSHIFNPAAFGIFLTVLLFGVFTQWKGTYSWCIIIPAGIYFVSKIKRLDLIVSFFLASLFLYIPQAFLHNVSLLNVFGYFNYFFIFIMMIEPKTTPKTRLGRVMFGLGAAGFIFAFYESGVLLEAELFALLILNFLYGISIIPYNWVGSEGCRHPSEGVTAERCDQILHFVQDRPDPEEREATKDEKEQFAASEGRSPYEKLRGAKRRVNLLGVFLERRKA